MPNLNIRTARFLLLLYVMADSSQTPDMRVQAIVDSLAGFCHALGQPATVLMSSVELLQMEGIDAATRKDVLSVCMDAVVEIKNLLAEMKRRREYLAEAYLSVSEGGGMIASMPEWSERMEIGAGATPPPPNLDGNKVSSLTQEPWHGIC